VGIGIDDRAGVEIKARVDPEQHDNTTIPFDRWVHVVLALIDGKTRS